MELFNILCKHVVVIQSFKRVLNLVNFNLLYLYNFILFVYGLNKLKLISFQSKQVATHTH